MQHKLPFVTAAVAMTICAAAHAGDCNPQQTYKLLADDGGNGDRFGRAVSLSNGITIVGAAGDDDNGSSAGAAYLFDVSNPEAPAELAKLLADDGDAHDNFGWAVDISDGTAVVGAYWDEDNGTDSGSAYLFDVSDPANPLQIAKLLPDDGASGDLFGYSVAIAGNLAVVGATGVDDNGSFSGSVYVFDTETGKQLAKLTAGDGAAGDEFGRDVDMDGMTIVVGALGDDGSRGAAYVFDISDPLNPAQVVKLVADDRSEGDFFGDAVAIHGAVALAGAPWDDDNGDFSGSAYLFDAATGGQLAKLLPDDGAGDDVFGTSVAMFDEVAVIGASNDDDNGLDTGSVYHFDITNPGNPQQVAKLLPDDGMFNEHFGRSVAVEGDISVIGADLDDDLGEWSGSAYVFTLNCPPPCPADIAGDDGMVGAADLLDLLKFWGPCKGCPQDINGDDAVGAADLLILLDQWGPCS